MAARRPSARSRRPAAWRRPDPESVAGEHTIATGTARISADRDDPLGWFVDVNGVPSSYVHLGDPTRLEFEYVRWIGDVIDVFSRPNHEPGEPLRVAHLGGAGCTLARYVAATRPGSRQVVYEIDGELVQLMRRAFLPRGSDGIRIRVCDARVGVQGLHRESQDLVIRDAFSGSAVPPHLTTMEFAAEVSRALAPYGIFVANVADRAAQRQARIEAATLREVFSHVSLIADPAQLRGRRYGNVVLLASQMPLPLEPLTRRLASSAFRARVVPPDRVRELVAGLRPRTDEPRPAGRS